MKCTAIDRCAMGDHGCGAGTRCVSLPNSDFRCECLDGYARRGGGRCEDIDECSAGPCPEGATCRNLDGSFACTCRAYYEASADGTECRDERITWSKVLPPLTRNVQPLVDAAGNLILMGMFAGELELCGELRVSRGESDIFVAKYDRTRRCRWLKTFGDASADTLISATLDPEGNPVLTGDFQGTLDLDGVMLESGGASARMIAKVSAFDGRAVWARSFSNLEADDLAVFRPKDGVASDRDGNVLWGARIPIDVGSPEETWREDREAYWDAMLVKLDARSGEIVWWKRYGGAALSTAHLTGVMSDRDGEVVIAGQYLNGIAFDGDELPGAPERWNGFVAKLSSDGEPRWHKWIDADLQTSSGLDWNSGLWIGPMPNGGIVAGGGFRGALRLSEPTLSRGGLEDVMVVHLDGENGDELWTRTWGGADEEWVGQLAVDASGRVALSATFSSEIDYGEGPLTTDPEWRDFVVASLDAKGELRWAQRFGGAGPDRVERLTVGPRGEIIVTGVFTPPIAIEDTLLPQTAGESVIVLQLEP